MLTRIPALHQANLFDTDLILQLDPTDPLLRLSAKIPWQEFEDEFAVYYKVHTGAPSKPIRLMVGLLVLKQLEKNIG
jgi:IS5 family transposase